MVELFGVAAGQVGAAGEFLLAADLGDGTVRKFLGSDTGTLQDSLGNACAGRIITALRDGDLLDPDTSVGIMQLLYRINRAGTTIMMVTHDREMVDKMRKRGEITCMVAITMRSGAALKTRTER